MTYKLSYELLIIPDSTPLLYRQHTPMRRDCIFSARASAAHQTASAKRHEPARSPLAHFSALLCLPSPPVSRLQPVGRDRRRRVGRGASVPTRRQGAGGGGGGARCPPPERRIPAEPIICLSNEPRRTRREDALQRFIVSASVRTTGGHAAMPEAGNVSGAVRHVSKQHAHAHVGRPQAVRNAPNMSAAARRDVWRPQWRSAGHRRPLAKVMGDIFNGCCRSIRDINFHTRARVGLNGEKKVLRTYVTTHQALSEKVRLWLLFSQMAELASS